MLLYIQIVMLNIIMKSVNVMKSWADWTKCQGNCIYVNIFQASKSMFQINYMWLDFTPSAWQCIYIFSKTITKQRCAWGPASSLLLSYWSVGVHSSVTATSSCRFSPFVPAHHMPSFPIKSAVGSMLTLRRSKDVK